MEPNSGRFLAIQVISRWREAVLAKTGWSSYRWGIESSVHPTTVTRSMSAHSTSSAKIETLHQLARGAGIPSVLDFLEAQAAGKVGPEFASEAVLTTTFIALLEAKRIDPFEDNLASQMAQNFSKVLRQVQALHDDVKQTHKGTKNV